MTPILEFQDVCFHYHSLSGEVPALSHISFQIEPRQFTAIVGPSGCGKSTILDLTFGLIEPEQGQIIGDKSSIGYMLQKDHLFHWCSIEKNILLGLDIQKKQSKEAKAFAYSLLKKYGLFDFKDKKPYELSGGMRQRAALIRTLVTNPNLLLLDEPFSALDYQTRLNVADDIGNIIRTEKKSAILVTHDLSEAISMADQILVLTKRPASIAKRFLLDFPSNLGAIDRRESEQFQHYFKEIWKEMNHESE